MKVKCIDPKGFSFLTLNKIYETEEESRDYYYVRNDANALKRYGKVRFETVAEIVEPKAPKAPRAPRVAKPKVKTVVCKLVTGNLRFNEKYTVISETDSHYEIAPGTGLPNEFYLKKRFEDA